jgi:hypothetical protein
LLCCAWLCFMLLFTLVCPVVSWCCHSRLVLCSGCFAAIVALVSPLKQILYCCERDGPPSADALPPSCSSGGCFAAVVSSLVDALPLWLYWRPWRMLCRWGWLSLGGCFATMVSSLVDALPLWSYWRPWRILCPRGCSSPCSFTTLLATNVLSSCIRLRLSRLRSWGRGSPLVFLVVRLYLWDFVSNPRITGESYVSSL